MKMYSIIVKLIVALIFASICLVVQFQLSNNLLYQKQCLPNHLLQRQMSNYKYQTLQSTLTSKQRMKNRAQRLIRAKSVTSDQSSVDASIKGEASKLGIGKMYEIEQGEIANQTNMECQNEANVKIEDQQDIMEQEIMEQESSPNYDQSPPQLSLTKTFRSYFQGQIVFMPVVQNIQIGAQQQSLRFLVPRQNQLISAEDFNKKVVERWFSLNGNIVNNANQKYYKEVIEKSFMQGKYRYAVQQCVIDILHHKQNIHNLQIHPRKKIEAQPCIAVGSPMYQGLAGQLRSNLQKRRIYKVD